MASDSQQKSVFASQNTVYAGVLSLTNKFNVKKKEKQLGC